MNFLRFVKGSFKIISKGCNVILFLGDFPDIINYLGWIWLCKPINTMA